MNAEKEHMLCVIYSLILVIMSYWKLPAKVKTGFIHSYNSINSSLQRSECLISNFLCSKEFVFCEDAGKCLHQRRHLPGDLPSLIGCSLSHQKQDFVLSECVFLSIFSFFIPFLFWEFTFIFHLVILLLCEDRIEAALLLLLSICEERLKELFFYCFFTWQKCVNASLTLLRL